MGIVAGMVLLSSTVFAQTKPIGCDKGGAPEKVEGQVIKIEPDNGTMTVRAADGTIHQFQASKETLQEYKVGDPIKAKLRSAPKCDK
jgi:hypothetical protein